MFPRADQGKSARQAPEKKGKKESKPQPEAATNLVGIEDFAKLSLKTAVVTHAEAVEGADKLLKLKVEVGGEERQIVAGIAQHYAPDTLVGRTIVLVANLKPARIRGIESQGMLLAAKKSGTLRLITVDGDIPAGANVG